MARPGASKLLSGFFISVHLLFPLGFAYLYILALLCPFAEGIVHIDRKAGQYNPQTEKTLVPTLQPIAGAMWWSGGEART